MLHQLHQDCLHRSWEAETLRLMETKAVKRNDHPSMQFTCHLGLQIRVHPILQLVLHPSLARGLNPPTRLIPMQMRAALATILQSSSSPPGMWMSVPMTSPSSPSQMHQLCPVPLPGMTQLPGRPVFWLQMRPSVAAQNWITL